MSFKSQIRKTNEPLDLFKQVEEKNAVAIKRLFRNNRFLLKLTGQTQKSQVEWFRKHGIIISEAGISRYANGHYKRCSLSYLQFFALYHHIDLSELMIRDLETEYHLLNSI
jgi:hypothetical protein